ncbi:ribose-phosphate diphosphokinase [Dongia sp.]|uniref:ribose-phosphate diphosphokinase n=1 Tax=Dongia sp. TaxID=1977262 RepID=UPI0035AEB74E
MTVTVHSFEASAKEARSLAQALGVAFSLVHCRHFPDGESLVRVERSLPVAILYCSLDRPNEKLVELMLAAAAMRENGAGRLILVAPYLAYMRQDMAFHPGEAVSQKVIGKFIADHFDALVTVDPHLHRTASLQQIMPGIATRIVPAAGTLSATLASDATPDTLLVGPDTESRPWVEEVAAPLGLQVLVGAKRRLGDRDVDLSIANVEMAAGRPVILVDDLISSGATLLRCAALARAAGARRIEVLATHCLAGQADLQALLAGGIARVRSTDTVPGPTAAVSMVPAIAAALRGLIGST